MNKSLLITLAITLLALVACGDNNSKKGNNNTTLEGGFNGPEAVDTEEPDIIVDTEAVDSNATEPDHIVISKKTLTLKVYDKYDRLICKYPIAAGRAYGKKQANGDLKSPEGEFYIGVIQDASRWSSVDNSGKSVKGARGNWFMHLDGGEVRGVGICGTLDPTIVGSRSTEGNIVLRNEDLDNLKTLVHSNMRVTILPADADLKADGIVVESDETTPAEQTTEEKRESKKDAKSNGAVTDGNGDVWHTIAKGEVLSTIASKYNTTVAKIKALNPGINVDRIREGQRIKVYGAAEATTTAVTKKSEEKKESPAGEVWHTIAKGEVLSKVASKYGTTLAKIKSLNPGINVDRIREGQKIRVK
jgi:LysM repeat protein